MTRGKAFTLVQDVAICNSRLNICQDPSNVVSQPQLNIWDRIYQNYVELTGDQSDRTQCAVQSRWKTIYGSCKKFHDCLTQIEDEQSALTEFDKVVHANRLYCQLEKKSFTLSHCWGILQHKIKWKGSTSAKRSDPFAMATDPKIHTSPKGSNPLVMATNHNVDLSPESADPHARPSNLKVDSSLSAYSLESDTVISFETDKDPFDTTASPKNKRPTRTEDVKEACKRSKLVDTMDSRFCELMEQFTKHLAETDERKAKVAERKIKIMEDTNERDQREQDDRIMSVDTSNMEPRARAYYEQRKNDIYLKTMASTKGTSEMDPNTRDQKDHDDICENDGTQFII